MSPFFTSLLPALLAVALLSGCAALSGDASRGEAAPPGNHASDISINRQLNDTPAEMKLFAWDDFWAGGHKAFQSDYQQYNTSVDVRFDPGTRPVHTEDRIFWSKKPLTFANYLVDGTWSQTVADTTETTLAITGLPSDRDIYLIAVRYHTDGSVYQPAAFCREMVKTSRMLTATAPNLDIELADSGEEFSDWFERQPTISMLTNDISALPGGGFQIAHRVTAAALSGGVFYGKKVLAPNYDWAVEYTFSFPDDGNMKPKYVTFGASSGTQAIVSISARDAHSPYPTTNPHVPAGFTITDPDLYDLVPYGTQYNYLMPGTDPTTQWWPRGTGPEWRRVPDAQTTIRFEYAANAKTVRIYHDKALIYTLSPLRGTTPSAPKRHPAEDHYGFGIRPQFLFEDLIETSSAVRIHNIKVESDCPYYYAEWTPGYGHAGYGHFVVPQKYDGALGVNIDDPDHSLGNLAFYAPFATADKEWWWPASRFSTRLHMGYTAPYDQGAQEAARPYAMKGLAYPYWTARTGYVAGVHTAKTPPIEVPAGTKPVQVVFRGLQQHGTLRARLLDQHGNALTDWQPVDKTFGAPQVAISSSFAGKATSVQCEFEIFYDGTSPIKQYINNRRNKVDVVYPYQLLQTTYNKMNQVTPDCPSLFIGYGVYFSADHAAEPSAMETTAILKSREDL